MVRFLAGPVSESSKKVLTVLILLFTLLTWRQLTLFLEESLLNEFNLPPWLITINLIIYNVSIIIIGLLVSLVSSKNRRAYFIVLWLTTIVVIPFVLLVSLNTYTIIWAWSFILGFSFGFGFPSCLAYFADVVPTVRRGRMSSVGFFFASLGTFLMAFLFQNFDIIQLTIFTTFWSIFWSLLNFFLMRKKTKREINENVRLSFLNIIKNKPVYLFLISWSMFCLVDGLEEPILNNYFGSQFYSFILPFYTLIVAIFIIIGGFISDFIGRKYAIIYGFISIGFAYAFMGIAPSLEIFWFLFFIVDAIAWGMFFPIFLIIIWGDLSSPEDREKYYVIGTFPFFLSIILRLILKEYLILIPASAAFSFASFFLFLAVIPLMFAPETLPEKEIRRRELRKYVEKAKKIREKYARKS